MSTGENMLFFSALLFCIGMAIVLTRKDLIRMLIGIELMLNSANINLVFFGGQDGRMTALFVLVIAVCEAAVGLAIFLRAYRFYRTAKTAELSELRETK